MPAHSRRTLLLAAALTILAAAVTAGSTRCTDCQRRLPERYWTYKGMNYCSERCANKPRPKCARCRGVIDGRYYESDGKMFCSSSCFETTLPACEICRDPIHSGFTITRHHYCTRCVEKNPTCFSCGLPAAHATKLADDREICAHCARWAVKDLKQAQLHYDRARRFLEAWTSMKIQSPPKLELVDRKQMLKLSADVRASQSAVPVRGLYSRQTYLRKRGFFGAWKESPEDSTEAIYLVDHLHDEVFRVAAIHELMHDLIHEQFERLEDAPLWVHEGICQQAAAEYCRRRNYLDALHLIDSCEDPDYGDGYRHIKRVAGFEGWPALKRWMETVDVEKLPKTAPKK